MNPYSSLPSVGAVAVAGDRAHFLAEGPTWDAERSRLLWVDIMDGAVYTGTIGEDDTISIVDRYDFPDTAGAVAVSETGELLVAGRHRLYVRRLDGRVESGPVLISGDGRRFNDGKPDPRGRYVVGTKGDGDGPESLLLVEDGRARILDADLTLSNGLAWSPDARALYSVDTLSRRIHVRAYDPATGETGDRRELLVFEGEGESHGYPDGITIDVDSHLWVAMWGAGCVLRISPQGEIVARIDLPVPHVSCPTFAGEDLDLLIITTATEGLSVQQLVEHPLSGRLFAARTGHRGLPAHHWNDSRVFGNTSKGNA